MAVAPQPKKILQTVFAQILKSQSTNKEGIVNTFGD